MPCLSALLNTMEPSGEGFAIEATADWLQGRTLYGGMSAGFCLEATRRLYADLPLLRTAHFTFAGPASGRLLVTPSLLRQGKSVAVVGVDVVGEAGLAVRAVLTFGTARESALSYLALPKPDCAAPADCANLFDGGPRPDFFGNFDVLSAGPNRPLSGAAEPAFLLWVRHRAPGDVDPFVALLALADAPPPAAFAMFARRAPISTVAWAVNIVGLPGDASAWHLISTRADSVLDGYSSQQMVVWDEDGRALVSAQQNVAVFL